VLDARAPSATRRRCHNGVTSLSRRTGNGNLPDQAGPAGVLDQLDTLGVVILEALKVPVEDSQADHENIKGPSTLASDE
jgi:hypothetical protein